MPIYEYKCKACDKEFEYQQRMSDPDKTLCEACGAEALERLISRTAFTLKGSGWYKDLYSSAKPEAKSTDAAGKSDSTVSGDSSSSKSESKSSDSSSSGSGGSSAGGSSSGGSSSGGSSGGSGGSGGSTSGSGSKAAASAS